MEGVVDTNLIDNLSENNTTYNIIKGDEGTTNTSLINGNETNWNHILSMHI